MVVDGVAVAAVDEEGEFEEARRKMDEEMGRSVRFCRGGGECPDQQQWVAWAASAAASSQ